MTQQMLTEVPVTTNSVPSGWECPVCGTVNAPTNEMCVNKCISKSIAENSLKHGNKQFLTERKVNNV